MRPRWLLTVLGFGWGFGEWLRRLLRLRRHIREYQQHWAEPQGEPGGLVYVALGDSAAQGIGASLPSLGYVGLLADRLRTATGRPVKVVNLSVTGAVLGDVLVEQLPRLLELHPDVVTLAVGGNDVRRHDRSRFVEQTKALLSALPAGTFVADAPYFMHGRWEVAAREICEVLHAHAADYDLVPVALNQTQRGRGWRAMITDFAADWFHPNDRGHGVWADAFWASMKDRLPALR